MVGGAGGRRDGREKPARGAANGAATGGRGRYCRHGDPQAHGQLGDDGSTSGATPSPTRPPRPARRTRRRTRPRRRPTARRRDRATGRRRGRAGPHQRRPRLVASAGSRRSCCCGPRTRARRCSPPPGWRSRPRSPGAAPARSALVLAHRAGRPGGPGLAQRPRRPAPRPWRTSAEASRSPPACWTRARCGSRSPARSCCWSRSRSRTASSPGSATSLAVAVGLVGNLVLRGGWLSWLPWAASYALLPAFLSYGGWGGEARGNPPEVLVTVLAALLGVGVHVLVALPGLVADHEDGLRHLPLRLGLRLGATKVLVLASVWTAWSWRRCCWPGTPSASPSRRPAGTAEAVPQSAALRTPPYLRRPENAPPSHHRPHRGQPAARRPDAVVVRLQLRHRPAVHAGRRHQQPRRLRRRPRRRDRLRPGRLGHLHRLARPTTTSRSRSTSSRSPGPAARP